MSHPFAADPTVPPDAPTVVIWDFDEAHLGALWPEPRSGCVVVHDADGTIPPDALGSRYEIMLRDVIVTPLLLDLAADPHPDPTWASGPDR